MRIVEFGLWDEQSAFRNLKFAFTILCPEKLK